ncbi:hypothetical protein ACRYJU_04520 [Alloalcanivorax xenomutans]|uniref:Uncharacterized protein n=1 Tax=Alcanivorax xiamenensis TaxID=1177156 RepID=A0ABQ6Y3M7_9GAMM|nr:hypothetical protein [Alcanivorax xiamenensis]KAF0803498.1 hypothetical protein A6D6_03670 [Alcanivorax xiamenensis]
MSTLQPLPEITHHEKLPPGAKEIARIQMRHPKKLYTFIQYDNRLIIHTSRDAVIDGKPDYICGQIDLPIGFLHWFPNALENFRKPPSEGGLQAGKLVSPTQIVEGEELSISRAMGDRAWPEKGPPPGYYIENRSRLQHDFDDEPELKDPQEMKFPESYLYNEGLLDFIKRLGDQYKAGLL